MSQQDKSADFLLNSKSVKEAGLKPKTVYRNVSVPQLYEMALKYETDTRIVASGALAAISYEKTGKFACLLHLRTATNETAVPSQRALSPAAVAQAARLGPA